jgi:recombination associated protein RdgC
MFKNALVWKIEQWQPPTLAEIDERLQRGRFVPCGATQAESVGWVPPRGDANGDRAHPLAESIGGQVLLRWRTETKPVPGAVVRAELKAKLDAIEAETGRRPKGRAAKELKEAVQHALLPRAFPKQADAFVWIDARGGWLWIGVSAVRRADPVLTRLAELFGSGVRFAPLQTALSPAGAMAGWLAEGEPPPGFGLDRECELKQPEGEQAVVRYARHALEGDGVAAELRAHLAAGKRPTRLALTYAGRMSFVLTDTLALRKIALTDVALEGAGVDAGARAASNADEAFDADVALFTGELGTLMPALVEALGGLQEPGLPAGASSADSAA